MAGKSTYQLSLGRDAQHQVQWCKSDHEGILELFAWQDIPVQISLGRDEQHQVQWYRSLAGNHQQGGFPVVGNQVFAVAGDLFPVADILQVWE